MSDDTKPRKTVQEGGVIDIEEHFTSPKWITPQVSRSLKDIKNTLPSGNYPAFPRRWSEYDPIPPPSDYAARLLYDTTWYQVNEQFTSIQGEGLYTGTPSTFIRLQGCTVGCVWCDSGPLADLVEGRMTNGETRNTWGKGGNRRTLTEIIANVRTRHVVITGGEPTLWNLDALIQALWDIGCVVQLETSGQNALKGELVPDWITWSPKLNLYYIPHEGIVNHIKEVKWVVDDLLEWDVVWNWWLFFQSRQQPVISLMPEGSPPKQEMIDKCLLWLEYVPLKHQREWRYSHRLQYVLGVR